MSFYKKDGEIYNYNSSSDLIVHYRPPPRGPGGLQGLPLGLELGRQSAICTVLCAKILGFS